MKPVKTLRAKKQQSAPVSYAQRKQSYRQLKRKQLGLRVIHPVLKQNADSTLAQSSRSKTRVKRVVQGALYFVAALMLHSSVFYGITIIDKAEQPQWIAPESKSTKVVFQVTEPIKTPTKSTQPISPVKPTEPKTVVEQPQREPERVRPALKKKLPRTKITKPLPADPIDETKPEAVAPERRRIVGISMESTVKSGSGPTMAVGNTRMGKTDTTAKDTKNLGKLSGSQAQTGVGTAIGSGLNVQAANIPTASVKFTKPKRLGKTKPLYPSRLKAQGIEGNVVVLIKIDANGNVADAKVLKSSGHSSFDKEALAAAKRDRFSPAKRGGDAVAYTLKYTYRFRLKGV